VEEGVTILDDEFSPTPPSPKPVVPLEYREKEGRTKELTGVFRLVRQVVFSLGLGLLFYGYGCTLAKTDLRDAPVFMGWGAALVALALGWPGWRWGYRKAD
jgi:hypothetical protein